MPRETKYVVKGGRVIDPANGIDRITEVYIDGQIIERVGGKKNFQGRQIIDATGMLVFPGLVDIHTHLREPGNEDAETIDSGANAAIRGGVTTICCMPNTNPPVDSASDVRYIYDRAQEAPCWVYPIAAISKGLKGEELSEMGDLAYAGAVAFSDDGRPVSNSQLLRNALAYADMLGLKLTLHCEDLQLTNEGSMHEGTVSGLSGIPAIPGISEAVMITRDLLIAEFLGVPVHICHVSAKESVHSIRAAKARGVSVTAEATPHHLILDDEKILDSGFDTNFKVNPPIRSREDIEALREALADGTIDAIATDHAPHSPHTKDKDFINAPFGIIGLETSASLIYSELVRKKVIDEVRMVELMSANPAKIFDLPAGALTQGAFADITIFDPEKKWTVDANQFASLSRNTPFAGWELTGKPVLTMVAGEIVYNETGE
ncbi:dihydroorotase [bacterium]|nr:MAG: dihydroorotase [bacterium]